jgi:DnaJ-domain-containing protein 1
MIVIGVFGGISYYISKKAESFFARMFFIIIGLIVISNNPTTATILYNPYIMIFLGFIAPHIKFATQSAIRLYLDLKYATINSYYFMLTIYYKTLNFIRAFKAFIERMKNIFSSKEEFFKNWSDNNSYRYQRQKNNYEREKAKYNNEDYQESSYDYNQEQEFYDRYSSFFDEDEERGNKEHSYQDNNSYNQYEESSSYQQNQYSGYKDEYHSGVPNELKQFYSLDPFEVLGVSQNDDCKAIKKQYRTLAKKYHPDKAPEYIEIMKYINNANDDVKEVKGC